MNPSLPPAAYHAYLPVVVRYNLPNVTPSDILLSNTSILENQPVNSVVGTLTTSDANSGDTFTYSLVSGSGETDNASFNISGDQLRSSQVFDYETKNSYSVRIRSTDQGGLFIEKAFLITITNTVEGGIINGDFEAGQVSWIEYSSNGFDIITHESEATLSAHNGEWFAWLGGFDNETSTISQIVNIPSGLSYLHYWYWIMSEDECGYDDFRVKMGATTVKTQNLCTSTNTYGWVHTSINLSAYVNVPLTLKFEAVTGSILISNIFLDDIYLASTATVSPESFVPGALDLDSTLKADR